MYSAGEDLSQLSELLLRLERLLLDPARRANPDSIADLFAEDFREVGKSGRTYDKATILAALRNENQLERRVILEDFRVVPLSASAALVTYTSIVLQPPPASRAYRSSIWVRSHSKWQIFFHQGTPMPEQSLRL